MKLYRPTEDKATHAVKFLEEGSRSVVAVEGGGGDGAASRSRVSSEQLELLLSFMEEHPEFASGRHAVYSRFSSSKLWRLLAERLNAAAADAGGARKSPDKWCRYWADIKYKARKKTAGELTTIEERLRNIMARDGGARDEEERKPALDEDAASSSSAASRVAADELLAEAAMRSALAAEKQAEAVAQAVELLRELLAIMRPPHHAL